MKTLKKGAKGKEVLALQKLLNKNGAKPKLAETSVFDVKTETAVKAFQQKARNLKVDGVFGPNSEFELSGKAKSAEVDWLFPGKADDFKLYATIIGTIKRNMAESLVASKGIKTELAKLAKFANNFETQLKKDAAVVAKVYDGNIRQLQNKLLALEKEHRKVKPARLKAEINKKAVELNARLKDVEMVASSGFDAEKYQNSVGSTQAMLATLKNL